MSLSAGVPNFDFPYCLLHRSGQTHFAGGAVKRHTRLDQIAWPAAGSEAPTISMVPYAQMREKRFQVNDGGEPILSLQPDVYRRIDMDHVVPPGEEEAIALEGPLTFNMEDAEFAQRVEAIIREEICNGEGANFLFSRKCKATIRHFTARTANTIFRRLARNEFGAYLTFCFFDGESYFVGASPERHITIDGQDVLMNPISGTLPKRALKSRGDLITFLQDPKEVNELFQVVDEELKMMSKICRQGGEIQGPTLKEMSTLLHTEYVLHGVSDMDKIEAFRHSMYAATMIGSPLESAARVIKKYETESRRYYSSAIVLMDRRPDGRERLDSAITIRTMEVDRQGRCVMQSGATIVRDSVPEKECLEVRAKAEGMVRAITSGEYSPPVLQSYLDDEVEATLLSRNRGLSRFWLHRQTTPIPLPELAGRRLLIVDNEDEFTYMLRHLFEHLGLRADVQRFDDPALDLAAADFVLIGPGPGDPTDLNDPKMATVHGLVDGLLQSKRPFMAVCLGHQILCHRLGLRIVKIDPPQQGVQNQIDFFGRREAVGFYNTFFALGPQEPVSRPGFPRLALLPSGEITALRGEHFASFQFHVESVLTTDGIGILRDTLHWLLTRTQAGLTPVPA